jgi:FkbM family methyltransferase
MLKRLQASLGRVIDARSFNENRVGRLLRYGIWQTVRRIQLRRPIPVRLDNGRRFECFTDCDTSWDVFILGGNHYHEIQFLRRHAAGGTLIDIGSNVGAFCLLLSSALRSAVLFEPNPRAASRARANLRLNGLDFPIHQQALSDHEGEAQFKGQGVSSTGRLITGAAPGAETVACTPLDKVIGKLDLSRRPLIVKIDAEGHDLQVIQGMRRVLAEVRPEFVMFERLGSLPIDQVQTLLADASYVVYGLGEQQVPYPVGDPRILGVISNLFASPEERARAVGL